MDPLNVYVCIRSLAELGFIRYPSRMDMLYMCGIQRSHRYDHDEAVSVIVPKRVQPADPPELAHQ